MNKKIVISLICTIFFSGCQGWILDYGKPAAQFLEKDVLTHSEDYLGEKITVKGIVFEVNAGENAKLILESGIECRFHKKGAVG